MSFLINRSPIEYRMGFFSTYIGMFIFQSVSHSIIALVITGMAMQIWQIRSPLSKFRYRLSVLFLPAAMFPLYQYINPDRGSFYFRNDTSLFDSMDWLGMEFFGGIPFGLIGIYLVIGTTTLVFVMQELLPITRESIIKDRDKPRIPADDHMTALVSEMARQLGIKVPEVVVIEDDVPYLYTGGIHNQSIIISSSLRNMLDERQLKASLAHEIAHVLRRSNRVTVFAYALRVLMFYNPVSLVIFRRIVQHDENICDDMTVSITKDPEALGSTLRLFYSDNEGTDKSGMSVKDSIESASHNLLLSERISRLDRGETLEPEGFGWGRYLLTVSSIACINYFVV